LSPLLVHTLAASIEKDSRLDLSVSWNIESILAFVSHQYTKLGRKLSWASTAFGWTLIQIQHTHTRNKHFQTKSYSWVPRAMSICWFDWRGPFSQVIRDCILLLTPRFTEISLVEEEVCHDWSTEGLSPKHTNNDHCIALITFSFCCFRHLFQIR